ncbi:hypothetical protein [Leifsonia sp. Leaf264]|uniref:hypothetical protein n=1 Tax=Leifsonia sp. Leaf264 TaxID=1736314 RepID=UPI0006F65077|nr:hypothetical protein [Leifsonia sp. Leaf264]KQO96636.1 hypothetical protein ASF30_16085 [Leifsonia sp. Leaf264]
MTWWIPVALVVLVAFIVLASHKGWVDFSNKTGRGTAGGGALGVVDEVFAPHRHEIEVQRERESVLPAPSPVADDDDKGILETNEADDPTTRFDGRIRLDL